MKTTKIVIKNMFGIRDMSLDGGSVEISGPKGSGKTSVLDSIRYALTNRSDRDYVVHKGADEGEIIIETDTGLSVDRKAMSAKSAGTVKVRDGSMLQTRPAEFLSKIFTPLQLNPVEFTQLSRQEKNRVILSLIEFPWDTNWIMEQFGEIPQGVDYSKHILEVLADIQAAPADTSALQQELDTAERMRKHLNEYQRMRAMQHEVDALTEQSQELTRKIELARELPAKILETATIPVEGLTVENGVPLIHGLPISNLSDGELLELCVDITVSKPGQLQIILIDGAERLDKESRDKLYAKCKAKGLQLIATRVTDSDVLEVTEL